MYITKQRAKKERRKEDLRNSAQLLEEDKQGIISLIWSLHTAAISLKSCTA